MLDIPAIRKDFPILNTAVHGRQLVYLDNAATMQMPEPVLRAVTEHYHTRNANVHRGVHSLSQRSTDAMERARSTVAAFLGAEPEEIVFTSGTTDALNRLARMLEPELRPGERVLVTAMEHHSNLIPWQELCRRTGARLEIVPLAETGDLDMDALRSMLSEPAAVVAAAWVSNVLGTVNPIGELAALTHEAGAILVVDAAQGLKLGDIDVRTLNCDYLAFSGHKLGALTGIGVLYGKKNLLEWQMPDAFGGGMVDRVSFQSASFGASPARFEAGTPNYVGAVSLGAALDYLTALGREEIAVREERLTTQAAAALAAIPGVQVLGRPARRHGAVSFTVSGVHPFDLGSLLDSLGFAVRTGHMCAEPLVGSLGTKSVVRVSPAFYNTEAEITHLAEAVGRLIPMIRGTNA